MRTLCFLILCLMVPAGLTTHNYYNVPMYGQPVTSTAPIQSARPNPVYQFARRRYSHNLPNIIFLKHLMELDCLKEIFNKGHQKNRERFPTKEHKLSDEGGPSQILNVGTPVGLVRDTHVNSQVTKWPKRPAQLEVEEKILSGSRKIPSRDEVIEDSKSVDATQSGEELKQNKAYHPKGDEKTNKKADPKEEELSFREDYMIEGSQDYPRGFPQAEEKSNETQTTMSSGRDDYYFPMMVSLGDDKKFSKFSQQPRIKATNSSRHKPGSYYHFWQSKKNHRIPPFEVEEIVEENMSVDVNHKNLDREKGLGFHGRKIFEFANNKNPEEKVKISVSVKGEKKEEKKIPEAMIDSSISQILQGLINPVNKFITTAEETEEVEVTTPKKSTLAKKASTPWERTEETTLFNPFKKFFDYPILQEKHQQDDVSKRQGLLNRSKHPLDTTVRRPITKTTNGFKNLSATLNYSKGTAKPTVETRRRQKTSFTPSLILKTTSDLHITGDSRQKPKSNFHVSDAPKRKTSSNIRVLKDPRQKTTSNSRVLEDPKQKTTASLYMTEDSRQKTTSNFQAAKDLKAKTTSNFQEPTVLKQKTTSNLQGATDLKQKTTSNLQRPTDLKQKTTSNFQGATVLKPKTTSNFLGATDLKQKTTSNLQRPTDLKQKTTSNFQGATDLKQKTTSNFQGATDLKKKTTSNFHVSENSKQKHTSNFYGPGDPKQKLTTNFVLKDPRQKTTSNFQIPDDSRQKTNRSNFHKTEDPKQKLTTIFQKLENSRQNNKYNSHITEDTKQKSTSNFQTPEDSRQKTTSNFHDSRHPRKKTTTNFQILEDARKKTASNFYVTENPKLKTTSKFYVLEEPKQKTTANLNITENPRQKSTFNLQIPEESKQKTDFHVTKNIKQNTTISSHVLENPKQKYKPNFQTTESPKQKTTISSLVLENPRQKYKSNFQTTESSKQKTTISSLVLENPRQKYKSNFQTTESPKQKTTSKITSKFYLSENPSQKFMSTFQIPEVPKQKTTAAVLEVSEEYSDSQWSKLLKGLFDNENKAKGMKTSFVPPVTRQSTTNNKQFSSTPVPPQKVTVSIKTEKKVQVVSTTELSSIETSSRSRSESSQEPSTVIPTLENDFVTNISETTTQYSEITTPNFIDPLDFPLDIINSKNQDAPWKNSRKMHFDQESQKSRTSEVPEHRRSDILITEEYADDENRVTAMSYLERLRKNGSRLVSDPLFNSTSKSIIPLIPVVINDLRDNKITSEDNGVLSDYFGKYWPYILALSNNTQLDILPLIRMKDEKDLENLLQSFIPEADSSTTAKATSTESDDVEDYDNLYDYMDDYRDMYQDILGHELDLYRKKKLRAKRDEEDAMKRSEAMREYFEGIEEEQRDEGNDYIFEDIVYDSALDDDDLAELFDVANLQVNITSWGR